MGSIGLFPGVAVPHAFFGTFFRAERKYYPPSGRQPHHPRRSRRVRPHSGPGVCACGRTKGLSARPLETFGHRSWRGTHGTASPAPAPYSAHHSPPGARGMRLWAHQRAFRSPFGNLRAPKLARKPMRRQVPIRAVVGASIPTRARGMRQRAHQRAFRSPFGNLRAPKLAKKP